MAGWVGSHHPSAGVGQGGGARQTSLKNLFRFDDKMIHSEVGADLAEPISIDFQFVCSNYTNQIRTSNRMNYVLIWT